jgi:hypothetical protein
VGSCIGAALCVLVLGVPLTHAATLSPANQSEIDALLTGLKTSGCQFNRNGTWYSPQDAQAHLARKLDYLVSKNAVSSTEQFIERAATKSSVTGQAYVVRCGNAPLVPSSVWLSRQLQILRAVSSKAGKIK